MSSPSESLPNDPIMLKQMLLEALAGRQSDRNTIQLLQEENTLLRQRLFGRKSEQITDPNSPQLGMFNEAETLAETHLSTLMKKPLPPVSEKAWQAQATAGDVAPHRSGT